MEQMRYSSELIAHKLHVQVEINHLFSQYVAMQSNAFEKLLRGERVDTTIFKSSKNKIDRSITKLKEMTAANTTQQDYLREVEAGQQELYTSLKALFKKTQDTIISKNEVTVLITSISDDVETLKNLRDLVVAEEDQSIKIHQQKYQSTLFFTPLSMLSLGMFSLIIFLISFWYINKERKKNMKTQTFLSSVLSSTENIISYFTPVYSMDGSIIDFNIAFNNENIKNIIGKSDTMLKDKLLSVELPMHFKNGVFEHLIACIESGENQYFEKKYTFNKQDFWFKTTATKMDEGVLTTSNDTTSEQLASENLNAVKAQLENQNLLLLDNRAFLSNIFKSISNVIMHFKSVRNAQGTIIDFEILFINDAINELTGDIPAEIKNKKATEVYPGIFENGVFEHMVNCIENEKQVHYEVEHQIDGKKMWFEATAIKLNDGVTVTTRDVTIEKQRTNELNNLNEQLEIQNSIFKDAEDIANVGSYIWYLDTNIAVISDNFYQILGYHSNAFEVTIEGFKKFVHPNDLERYNQLTTETAEKGSTDIHTYRIITKTGKVKHLYVSGQKEIRNGRDVSIGVVQDITDQVKAENKLKAKNEELKRSNEELESFNRVASHDLQEPLRKIQMFISRISEGELDALSEKSKMYFNKIDSAAHRMQTLIKYLLAYARLNNEKKDFTQVSLNETIVKVLDDLEERIEASEVKITVDQLPVVHAIPFQMEQLFNNLISNAIKYGSLNDDAKILIDCKKLSKNNIPEEFNKKRKYYYRISVMDNGIGFEQENAKKIFGLFERLHQKDEYSGTGIGLAICKKIVLNHKGHIMAESEKGKGTTFCVFLPV